MHVRFRDTLPGLARQNYNYTKGLVRLTKRYAKHQPKGWLRGRIRRNLEAWGGAGAGICRGELRAAQGRPAGAGGLPLEARRGGGQDRRHAALPQPAALRRVRMYQTDCVVVGAGVVGLAVARALALGRARGRRARARGADRQPHQLAQLRGDPRRHLLSAGLGQGAALRRGRDLLYAYCESRGRAAPAARQDHRRDRAGAGGRARRDRRGGGGERGRRPRAARGRRARGGWSRRSAAWRGSSRPRPGSSTATR